MEGGRRLRGGRRSLPARRLRLRLRPVTAVADALRGEGCPEGRGGRGSPRRTNESAVVMGGKSYTNFPLG